MVQYKMVVEWDATLIDVGFLDTLGGNPVKGLVCSAVKITTGAPAATAGYFIPSAMIQNAIDGTVYINEGTTASPVWRLIEAGTIALANGQIFVGSAGGVAVGVTPSGVLSMTNAGVFSIVDGTVVNADINASAAIAFSKLASLTAAHILVGSAGGVATDVAMSGDAAISDAGVVTVTDLTITGEAEGDILYRNATNWVRLAKGTAGQVLTMNAGATAPEWQTPA